MSNAYVQAVVASRPDIYWRFEELAEGRVPNQVGPRWSGKTFSAPKQPSAIVIHDGFARFSATNFPQRLEAEQAIPGFNRESFRIEFWVSPDRIHWATLAAVVPEEPAKRNLHLSLVELPYKSSIVYTPGSFRFLHRHPP